MADPKFKFYRVRHSDAIVPALKHPAGYEDDHPDEYEGVANDLAPTAPVLVDADSSAPPVVVSESAPLAPPAPPAPVAPTAPVGTAAPVAPSAPAGPMPPAPPIPALSPSIVGARDESFEDA